MGSASCFNTFLHLFHTSLNKTEIKVKIIRSRHVNKHTSMYKIMLLLLVVVVVVVVSL